MTGNDVKKGKPAPDIYKASADSISVASEACVVFEDVPDGIKAAKAAGMYVGAVEDDFSAPFEKEKRKLSDFWIKDYRDLINK
jgi:16S rRNA pseudouridine516 synthase